MGKENYNAILNFQLKIDLVKKKIIDLKIWKSILRNSPRTSYTNTINFVFLEVHLFTGVLQKPCTS